MIGAASRFRQLMTELLLERELAGGVLSEEHESRYAAELERCWWVMSEEDQAQAERLFSDDQIPAMAEQPTQEDRQVERGSHEPPRRQKAA